MISESLLTDIMHSINGLSSQREQFMDFQSIGGGCINHTGKITTDKNNYFVKWNDRNTYPGMFEAEKEGLEALRESKMSLPQPLLCGNSCNYSFLLMEWIDSADRKANYWNLLAVQLAEIHRLTHTEYGWKSSNYIGSLAQENIFTNDWIEFFIHFRLEKQLKIALDSGKLGSRHNKIFSNLFKILPQLLPVEPPSMLHGDLWSGNVMVGETGNPVLIDPAVYYGNREIEISFTYMFGGFHREFYETYDACWPLQPGFSERVSIYNLYPLLVHINLFGGGYIHQLESSISDYS